MLIDFYPLLIYYKYSLLKVNSQIIILKGNYIMQKNKAYIPLILCITLFITTIAGAGFSIFLLTNNSFYSESDISSIKDSANKELINRIEERLAAGETMTAILRDIDPDKMVYVSNGTYVFADIDHSLKKNTLENGTFTKSSSGEITYSENNSVVSHKGIDLSKYQGDVDFAKVKASGVEYAMLRCGYRSYGSGILTEDTSFNTYAADALKNNLKIGAYFFTQAINVEEAKEEADYVINMLKPYNITYPVVIDVEEIFDDTYRQMHLSKSELTDVIVAFCERIKTAGYTPMIYSNLSSFLDNIDLTRVEDYEKWFAYYNDEPYFPYEISMWQYSDSGNVDGISGNVDLDISFKTWN